MAGAEGKWKRGHQVQWGRKEWRRSSSISGYGTLVTVLGLVQEEGERLEVNECHNEGEEARSA